MLSSLYLSDVAQSKVSSPLRQQLAVAVYRSPQLMNNSNHLMIKICAYALLVKMYASAMAETEL